MEIVKKLTFNRDKVGLFNHSVEKWRDRFKKVGERYNAKRIEFFEQDGMNFRNNKVTVVFYA